MKKIVIHCASGIKNTGDEAILDVLLQAYGTSCEITVISLDAKYSSKMHPGYRFISNSDSQWKEAIKACDLFILGGGGLIQDKTTIFNVGRWISKLKYAQKLHKKTFVYANSLEPFNYRINEKMARSCLKKADCITVRDPISLKIAQDMGIDNVLLTADPVYSYVYQEKNMQNLPEKYVVMTIRHWYDTHPFIPVKICSKLNIRNKKNQDKYDRMIEQLISITDYINESCHLPIVWLSCCYGRDGKVALDVIKRTAHPDMNQMIEDEDLTPNDMMNIIGKASLLIGMRLHGFIYSFLCKTPVILLSYQEKVKGMARLADIEDSCFSIDSFEAKEVIEQVNTILEDADKQMDKIERFVENMKKKQEENERCAKGLLGEYYGEIN